MGAQTKHLTWSVIININQIVKVTPRSVNVSLVYECVTLIYCIIKSRKHQRNFIKIIIRRREGSVSCCYFNSVYFDSVVI